MLLQYIVIIHTWITWDNWYNLRKITITTTTRMILRSITRMVTKPLTSSLVTPGEEGGAGEVNTPLDTLGPILVSTTTGPCTHNNTVVHGAPYY